MTVDGIEVDLTPTGWMGYVEVTWAFAGRQFRVSISRLNYRNTKQFLSEVRRTVRQSTCCGEAGTNSGQHSEDCKNYRERA